jgi:hypothetical protein
MSLQWRTRISKLFAFVIIVSALACSELPELMKLMDNPSNDFITAPAGSMGKIADSVTDQVTVTNSVSPVEERQASSALLQQTEAFRDSGDLLALYSLRRT